MVLRRIDGVRRERSVRPVVRGRRRPAAARNGIGTGPTRDEDEVAVRAILPRPGARGPVRVAPAVVADVPDEQRLILLERAGVQRSLAAGLDTQRQRTPRLGNGGRGREPHGHQRVRRSLEHVAAQGRAQVRAAAEARRRRDGQANPHPRRLAVRRRRHAHRVLRAGEVQLDDLLRERLKPVLARRGGPPGTAVGLRARNEADRGEQRAGRRRLRQGVPQAARDEPRYGRGERDGAERERATDAATCPGARSWVLTRIHHGRVGTGNAPRLSGGARAIKGAPRGPSVARPDGCLLRPPLESRILRSTTASRRSSRRASRCRRPCRLRGRRA